MEFLECCMILRFILLYWESDSTTSGQKVWESERFNKLRGADKCLKSKKNLDSEGHGALDNVVNPMLFCMLVR